jgi:glutamine amidotransferase
MTYLGDDWEKQYDVEEMKTALYKTIDKIIELQMNVIPEKDLQPSSLNVCVTDGEQLVGIRFRNVEGDNHQPPVSNFLDPARCSVHSPKFSCPA